MQIRTLRDKVSKNGNIYEFFLHEILAQAYLRIFEFQMI